MLTEEKINNSITSPRDEQAMNWGQLILSRIDKLDPNLIKDNEEIDPEKDYSAFPATKGNKPQKYFRRIEDLLKAVEEEYLLFGPIKQFQRDSKLWRLTLKYAGNQARREFLRRIFTTLRFGGFMYSHKKGEWKFWSESGFPIAAAMSHGSRVLIQTPPLNDDSDSKDKRDHSFWNWLVTGDKNGDISKFISIEVSGDQAEKENKIIFKRLGATHGIEYGDETQVEKLPENRTKYIVENKPIGINFRNTKILSSNEKVLYHHRHWGCNVPIGGHNRNSLIGEKISANGEHGHLYIYYMSAAKHRCGGILIGLEGSEYNKWDQVGHKHALIADSSTHSPTFGFKWHHKSKKDGGPPVDLSEANGPLKYNGMFIDLSKGWDYLIEEHKNWKDDWVMETSLKPKKIKEEIEIEIIIEKKKLDEKEDNELNKKEIEVDKKFEDLKRGSSFRKRSNEIMKNENTSNIQNPQLFVQEVIEQKDLPPVPKINYKRLSGSELPPIPQSLLTEIPEKRSISHKELPPIPVKKRHETQFPKSPKESE